MKITLNENSRKELEVIGEYLENKSIDIKDKNVQWILLDMLEVLADYLDK